jgi:Fe-Mn family superoxide dismutase
MLNEMNNKNRRDFMKIAAAGGAFAALQSMGFAAETKGKEAPAAPVQPAASSGVDYTPMVALPYAQNALEPYISAKTVDLHYNDHHKSYHDRLRAYIASNPQYDKMPIEKLVAKTKDGILIDDTVFNLAVLLYGHNVYWQTMKPKGGIMLDEKKSRLTKMVIDSFGSVDAFKKTFIDKAMDLGIGWVWLVKSDKGIEIQRTVYHDSPIPTPDAILATCDVWEHAYYMDYNNHRQKYVENYLNFLINWEGAEAKVKSAGVKK